MRAAGGTEGPPRGPCGPLSFSPEAKSRCTLESVTNPDTFPGALPMSISLASLAVLALNTFVTRKGRIVLTDLPTLADVERYEARREMDIIYDIERYVHVSEIPVIIEGGAVPGSLWADVLKYGQDIDAWDVDYEYIDMADQTRREFEYIEGKADAFEAELYARLERPRKVRQEPLPAHHFKRWGHGNARELINRVGQFAHMRAA